MCKASASVLVVVVPLLALLCTTVMHMCQMTLLLLRLPILNARTSHTQTFYSSYTENCHLLCFVRSLSVTVHRQDAWGRCIFCI